MSVSSRPSVYREVNERIAEITAGWNGHEQPDADLVVERHADFVVLDEGPGAC